MANQELIEWIKENRKRGFCNKELCDLYLKNGGSLFDYKAAEKNTNIEENSKKLNINKKIDINRVPKKIQGLIFGLSIGLISWLFSFPFYIGFKFVFLVLEVLSIILSAFPWVLWAFLDIIMVEAGLYIPKANCATTFLMFQFNCFSSYFVIFIPALYFYIFPPNKKTIKIYIILNVLGIVLILIGILSLPWAIHSFGR
jgi:hypothetical protein